VRVRTQRNSTDYFIQAEREVFLDTVTSEGNTRL
jgi:hypothetical protein